MSIDKKEELLSAQNLKARQKIGVLEIEVQRLSKYVNREARRTKKFADDSNSVVIGLVDENKEQASEIERLREFTAYVIGQIWEDKRDRFHAGGETDDGSFQDLAEDLGLIELRPITPAQSLSGETERYFLTWTKEVTQQRS